MVFALDLWSKILGGPTGAVANRTGSLVEQVQFVAGRANALSSKIIDGEATGATADSQGSLAEQTRFIADESNRRLIYFERLAVPISNVWGNTKAVTVTVPMGRYFQVIVLTDQTSSRPLLTRIQVVNVSVMLRARIQASGVVSGLLSSTQTEIPATHSMIVQSIPIAGTGTAQTVTVQMRTSTTSPNFNIAVLVEQL